MSTNPQIGSSPIVMAAFDMLSTETPSFDTEHKLSKYSKEKFLP